MSKSEKEQKAHKIKSSIVSSCQYVQESDINITHDISKFRP